MSKSLIEIKHALLSYFLQEDTINPENHHALVKVDCEDSCLKIALIKSALQDFEKAELVNKVDVKRVNSSAEEHWALVKPLALYEKQISFSCETAIGLAEAINSYFKAIGKPNEVTDPLSLKERDLQKVALIVESLMPKSTEN